MYGYMSQIITFTDIELEKAFIFLKYLDRKLPKRDSDKFDLSNYIDLDSLRIQKSHEKMEKLESEEHFGTPPVFDESDSGDPKRDLLSEIIKNLNETYGFNLTEDDKLNVERVHKGLIKDAEVRVYMQGDSSLENKEVYFRSQFNERMVGLVKDSLDFYKKLENQPEAKNMIFQHLFSDYQKQKTPPALSRR